VEKESPYPNVGLQKGQSEMEREGEGNKKRGETALNREKKN